MHDLEVIEKIGEAISLGGLFHGTTREFDVFDPARTFDGGLYFTDNIENAIEYGAMSHHEKPVFVIEAEVVLQRPLRLDFEGRVFEESVQRMLEDKIADGKRTGEFDGILIENIDDLAYGQENRMVIAFRSDQVSIVSRKLADELEFSSTMRPF